MTTSTFKKKAKKIPSESSEQYQFVRWFRETFKGVKIFAIPNGGARSMATAVALKREGVLPGVPDLCIPEWKVWVEMKRSKGGSLSDDQKDMIHYLTQCGYVVLVAHGHKEAIRQIKELIEPII